MEKLRATIKKVFRGAAKSFYRFPAAIVSAIIISIVAVIRISMEWNVQRTYSLLFDSIQMAFVLGAVFSMAAVTLDEVTEGKEKSFFKLANILGLVVAGVSFLLLYFFGGKMGLNLSMYLSSIAFARVSAGIFISAVAFIIIMSKSKFVGTFSDSFFITHRAFIISTTYGFVIMLGVSGVLGAFQALIYNGMDYRVYQYLGVAVAFLAYTMFLGYFPGFKENENEIEIRNKKEQPRFVFVLLDYIMLPIMMALTIVLLIWSARVMLKGVDVSFNALSGIASSYVMIGIWLHIMVAKHETKIAEFYRKSYVVAGILILLFQGWALFKQISQYGFQTTEYSFLMIWIFAGISVLLLAIMQGKAYRKIAVTAGVIAMIWVLPLVGYQDVTFNSQVNRLESLLISEELLVDDMIIAKDGETEHAKKAQITSAVDFISYSDNSNLPVWYKKDLNDYTIFQATFGFEKTYRSEPNESDESSIDFQLMADTIDISDYSVSLNTDSHEIDHYNVFGDYQIIVSEEDKGIAKIIVKHGDEIIIEDDMSQYLSRLTGKFSPDEHDHVEASFEDMSMTLQGDGIEVLLVFNNVNIYNDKAQEKIDYYMSFYGIYVKQQ